MDRNEVEIAFEIVMEEIEAVADALNQEGAAAFQRGDYEEEGRSSRMPLGLPTSEPRSKLSSKSGRRAFQRLDERKPGALIWEGCAVACGPGRTHSVSLS